MRSKTIDYVTLCNVPQAQAPRNKYYSEGSKYKDWRPKLMGQRSTLEGGGGGVHVHHLSGNFGHALMLLGAFLGHLTEM